MNTESRARGLPVTAQGTKGRLGEGGPGLAFKTLGSNAAVPAGACPHFPQEHPRINSARRRAVRSGRMLCTVNSVKFNDRRGLCFSKALTFAHRRISELFPLVSPAKIDGSERPTAADMSLESALCFDLRLTKLVAAEALLDSCRRTAGRRTHVRSIGTNEIAGVFDRLVSQSVGSSLVAICNRRPRTPRRLSP